MSAVQEIVLVIHVGIGFALERDPAVGPSFQRKADEPFDDVPEIESGNAHLQHLRRVDALMLDEIVRQYDTLAAEKQAEQIDRVVAPERDETVVDDPHVAAKIVNIKQTALMQGNNALIICIFKEF